MQSGVNPKPTVVIVRMPARTTLPASPATSWSVDAQ